MVVVVMVVVVVIEAVEGIAFRSDTIILYSYSWFEILFCHIC